MGKHIAKSQEPANMILVADTDMLTDRFWVRVQELLGSRLAVPTAGNGDFAINALDNLVAQAIHQCSKPASSLARLFAWIRQASELARAKEQQLTDELNVTEKKLVELESAKSSPSCRHGYSDTGSGRGNRAVSTGKSVCP